MSLTLLFLNLTFYHYHRLRKFFFLNIAVANFFAPHSHLQNIVQPRTLLLQLQPVPSYANSIKNKDNVLLIILEVHV